MGAFTPKFEAAKEQPRSLWIRANKRKAFILSVLKDQISFTSLLAIGATLNLILYAAIGSKALFLAPLLLAVRMIDTVLQVYGVRKNPYMENVVLGSKVSAQYPSPDGTFSGKPADGEVVVFMIGARMNHPLGYFAPGGKELNDYFTAMNKELDKNAAEYGVLGAQHWVSNGQRGRVNENMSVMFFKSVDDLHRYAHGPLHREGWNWWNKTEKDHPHIGIWHEVFVAPRGKWETIYVNSEPLGFGAASFPIKTEAGVRWQSPLVDASRGPLRTSRGRMTLSDGQDHEKYAEDPYNGRV